MTRYVAFAVRASRSESWWCLLGFVVVSVILSFVNKAYVAPPASTAPDVVLASTAQVSVLQPIRTALNLLGATALTVRRLHDAGLSGWW